VSKLVNELRIIASYLRNEHSSLTIVGRTYAVMTLTFLLSISINSYDTWNLINVMFIALKVYFAFFKCSLALQILYKIVFKYSIYSFYNCKYTMISSRYMTKY
jgi:hypothetical protein